MSSTPQDILDWHHRFATAVRECNLAEGLTLFAPDAQGFGTVVEYAADRDHLHHDQWRHVWPHTRHFHFLPAPMETILSADGSQACVLALWESEGLKPDGTPFPRRGRCTTVLRRNPQAPCGWLAIHTHYSRSPAGDL